MSVNPDGSLSSSRGVLADRKAASPPVKPTPKPEEPAVPAPEESYPSGEDWLPEEPAAPAPEESLPPEAASEPTPEPTPQPASAPGPSDNLLPAMPVPAGT
jgi:hypothetical protein